LHGALWPMHNADVLTPPLKYPERVKAGADRCIIGTAGWAITRAAAHAFPGDGTHLARYARVFSGAEINSSFHRPHAQSTYAKWAASTPESFRFAVKLPRTITHEGKLRRARLPLERLLQESSGLGDRRGPLLVQLPPSFAFDARVVGRFLELLRARHEGEVVCEPRHPTWFDRRADRLLTAFRIARAAADPAVVPAAALPGGWHGLVYYRLHGSPRKYWSRYEDSFVGHIAASLRDVPAQTPAWCIYDNTASGAAIENALETRRALAPLTAPRA
jgi:uncharacterized protein YecE (DUF72 family)